jgi:hypothetical protein
MCVEAAAGRDGVDAAVAAFCEAAFAWPLPADGVVGPGFFVVSARALSRGSAGFIGGGPSGFDAEVGDGSGLLGEAGASVPRGDRGDDGNGATAPGSSATARFSGIAAGFTGAVSPAAGRACAASAPPRCASTPRAAGETGTPEGEAVPAEGAGAETAA